MDTMNTFKKDEQMNTFTKDEQTILKNTSAKYKWIARDKNGELWVYKRKPKKFNTVYGDDVAGGFRLEPFEGLFKEVTWKGGGYDLEKMYLTRRSASISKRY